MSGYSAFARYYDDLTANIDYKKRGEYFHEIIKKFKVTKENILLDLACGTGTMSFLLAERGYELIGVDFSPEMLAVAAEKPLSADRERPIFLCQPMEELDLYGTIDACVCLLDSVNHVTSAERLRLALSRVHLFLEPGGLFVFDIHTPEHLESLDGGIFLDETEDAYCVWRTEYRRGLCSYYMDLFRLQSDGSWERDFELHRERGYTVEELTAWLSAAGFGDIRTYGDGKLRAPKDGEQRIYFTAVRE